MSTKDLNFELFKNGGYEIALKEIEKAIDMIIADIGEGSQGEARAHHIMGFIHRDKNSLQEAEREFTKAFQISSKILKEDDRTTYRW